MRRTKGGQSYAVHSVQDESSALRVAACGCPINHRPEGTGALGLGLHPCCPLDARASDRLRLEGWRLRRREGRLLPLDASQQALRSKQSKQTGCVQVSRVERGSSPFAPAHLERAHAQDACRWVRIARECWGRSGARALTAFSDSIAVALFLRLIEAEPSRPTLGGPLRWLPADTSPRTRASRSSRCALFRSISSSCFEVNVRPP